jgi:hypothetical protein
MNDARVCAREMRHRPSVLDMTIRAQRKEIDGDFAAPCFPTRQIKHRFAGKTAAARPGKRRV